VILEHSRLQGIVKGTPLGELQINDIMADEKVEPGERLITSGGDRIYPKGYAVGTVIGATPDRENDPFLVIKIKPAADLNRLEEVLVITEMADNSRSAASGPAPMRAADILSQRLPSVPKADPNAPKTPGVSPQSVPAATASPTPAKGSKTVSTGNEQKAGVQAGSAKPVTTGPGTAATASTANKTAAESKKQQALGQGSVAPASAGPRPTPKKTKSPTVTPDITTPDQPAATPTATPAANQEKPPR
jgi:rod shape-determining protein MreC